MIEEGLLAACALEGSYDLRQLRTVPPEPDARWAMLQVLIPELDLRAVPDAGADAFAWQKLPLQATGRTTTRQALKELMAEAGDRRRVRLRAAERASRRFCEEIQESGECVSLRDLAVSGRDFPALARKGGQAKCCRQLLGYVLLHPEDNNRQTLLRLAEERLRKFRF